MEKRTFTALLQREEGVWVSQCPELDVASQGDTMEEARANLAEAIALFLESADPAEIRQRLHEETYLTPLEVQVG